MAREEDFMTLLIASERVESWLDVLRAHKRGEASLVRTKQALKDLVASLHSEAYAEEARRAGAVPLLTALLKRTDDEDTLNDVSDALAALSGLMATSGKVRTFTYGGTPVVLKEGALGDGVGAKVWTVAHTFCREMARHPSIVSGRSVLEIGSGCGACGILAAKLGASTVVLSDYVDAVLCNLRDCVHLNAAAGATDGAAAAASSAAAAAAAAAANVAAENGGRGAASWQQRQQAEAEAEAWDPEDASECGSDDFDALLGEALVGGKAAGNSDSGDSHQQQGAASASAAAGSASWDAPPMAVRFYDWQESADQLSAEQRAALAAVPGVPRSTAVPPGASIDTASNHSAAPSMLAEEQYDVIIGTDILYEWPMVLLVPAVIKHRMRPGGRTLLCCAVREQTMFDAAVGALAALGLRVGITPVEPAAEDVLDIRQDYEGGYVLIAVEHADAPADDWHRPDLFA